MPASTEFFSDFSKLTPTLWHKLYQDITLFRQLFDLPCESGINEDKSCQLHSNLMIEELTELARATNKEEQADALTDTVYVAMGRAVQRGQKSLSESTIARDVDVLLNICHALDIDFERCWDAVQASNISKACETETQAKETQQTYAQKGVKAAFKAKGEKFIVYCSEDSIANNGITIKQGKILKSNYYQEVDLSFVN